jgi:hypothetical protein
MRKEVKEDLDDPGAEKLFIRIRYLMLQARMHPTALEKEGLLAADSPIWEKLKRRAVTDEEAPPTEPVLEAQVQGKGAGQ